MKKFLHSAAWSNVRSVEFIRTLKDMSGVHLDGYGYSNGGYFEVSFYADEEAELFLKLRYSDFFSEIIK